MTLIIDSREKAFIDNTNNLNPSIYKNQIQQLDVGDFHLVTELGTLIIERKTVADLINSVKDGRYSEQKIRLLQERQKKKQQEEPQNTEDRTTNNKILYIIEGRIDLSDEMQLGCYTSISLGDEIPIMFTSDIHQTIKYIFGLQKRLIKNPSKYFAYKPITHESYVNASISAKKKENTTRESVLMNQMCAIPGISKTKARIIINHCKATCMSDIIRFIEEHKTLTCCSGIGKKLDHVICDFLLPITESHET